MLAHDSLDTLSLVHDRSRRLHEQAAAERLRDRSAMRATLAATLRRAADRLDHSALVRQPGGQH